MRSRTHASFCDYGMSGAGGAIPCTCGVSPAGQTTADQVADQVIRMAALDAAARLFAAGMVATKYGTVEGDKVLDGARHFEAYLRGETP